MDVNLTQLTISSVTYLVDDTFNPLFQFLIGNFPIFTDFGCFNEVNTRFNIDCLLAVTEEDLLLVKL